jgi:hypothetical protein
MNTDLVTRAQGGDQEAFADLVHAVADRFLAVSHRILSDIGVFSDCDGGEFRTLVQSDGHTSALSHEDPGQFDLLTILDVKGQLVIFDVSYFEGTPEPVFNQIAGIVESANLDYAP